MKQKQQIIESMAKLTESTNQAVSALVDDETVDNAGALLDEIAGNDESRATWHCYHLIRDVMQRDYSTALRPDLARAISRQLESEEFADEMPGGNVHNLNAYAKKSGVTSSGRTGRRSFVMPIAGLGLAASVAVASFVGFQYFSATGQPDVSASDSTIAATGSSESDVVTAQTEPQSPETGQSGLLPRAVLSASGTRWRQATESPRDKLVEQRLNSLLTNHLEDAAMGKVHGILSHSRVVSYDLPVSNEGN